MSSTKIARTIGEGLNALKSTQRDVPDSLAPWLDRNGAIVFDGEPLREHPLDPPGPRSGEKEKLAYLLVACDVDREVREVVTLPERHGVSTPDFEARLRDGRTVRIELTSFRDAEATPYVGNLNKAFNALWEMRDADPILESAIAGRHFEFVFPDRAPRAGEAKAVAGEIALILRAVGELSEDEARRQLGMNDWQPPRECPLLTAYGVRWSLILGQPDGWVRFRPPLDAVDEDRILASMPTVLANKAKKIVGYSDDGRYPVWLAVFLAIGFSYTPLIALQTVRDVTPDVASLPFERILLGLSTAGILLERDASKSSYYNSLAEYHGRINRASGELRSMDA